MKPSIIPFTTTVSAITAAVLVTGCCGPKRDRTTAYYNSGSATTQYSSANETPRTYASEQSTTDTMQSSTAPVTTTQSERTNVRESVSGTGQNEWSLPLYSESLRVGKREVENGNVRLRKVVRTENATQPVDLRRETVVIDREAFDQARQAADAGQANTSGIAFQEKEITIDLRREEPIAEVQPYMSGRIVAQKRVNTEQQTVNRQVRHEDVEVIKSGNDRDIMISDRVRANVRTDAVGAPGSSTRTQSGTIQNRSNDAGSQGQRLNNDESEPTRRQQ